MTKDRVPTEVWSLRQVNSDLNSNTGFRPTGFRLQIGLEPEGKPSGKDSVRHTAVLHVASKSVPTSSELNGGSARPIQ